MPSAATLKVTTPSDREISMTRVFDAPRHLVFEAWTKPELLKRWLYGPEDWRLADCKIDLRPGGPLRFEWRHHNGNHVGFRGVYREIAPPDRLVFTEVWDEDWTGGETLVTITFAEHAGKTTMMQTVLYSSRDARDAALKTGMEHGAAQSFDRLAEFLAGKNQ
ncbi:MAG: SRPBCC family protein [Candidatus Acidiferrales bacterium]